MRPPALLLLALLLLAPGCASRADALKAEIAGLEEQIRKTEERLPVLEDKKGQLARSKAAVDALERMLGELRARVGQKP